MSRERNGVRKRRDSFPQKVPDLGYYFVVTDTKETERNYLYGLRDALPAELQGRIVIKVSSAKTKELISSQNFYIALGYNYKARTDMSTYSRSFISGFSIGGGLKVKNFGVNLALSQPHSGALSLMFNLSCNLDNLIK